MKTWFQLNYAVAASLVFGSMLLSSAAQDLRKDLPKPVPPLVQPPTSSTNELAVDAEALKIGALQGEAVILKELKGVVFLPSQSLVKAGPFKAQSGLDATQVPMLPAEALAVLKQAFIGQPASRPSLDRLAMVTRLTLTQLGYPFVAAYLPPQDITEGWVQVVVHMSVAAAVVEVEGGKYFSTNLYRSAIRQQPGQPINAAQLREDVDWLNRNPFRATSFVAARGQEPGTTQVILRTQEHFPWRFSSGYNNTGSKVSDEDRITAGVNWGNAFGLGHQLGYQFSASPDLKTTLAHSGNYAFDLPWRHTVRVTGAFSELEGRVAAPLTLKGRSWQVGLRYDIPLPKPAPSYTHTLTLGADFKASNNNLEFATIPITDNLTHIAQLNLGYEASLADNWGRTDFGATLNVSPGGIGHRNREQFFAISRAGAEPHYAYANFTLARSHLSVQASF